ncbi:MAG TPA: hypothetical protein VK932_12795 [Kofleriaceae bacterium]|nr:hypothetical protein [Kofleriaceae bacterium]
MIRKALLSFALLASFTSAAVAGPDYVCKDNRVEKGGSTQFTIRRSGSDITVEKGGSTKGKAVKRGSKLHVEVGGSTKATIENGKIEKGGSSWSTTSEAQRQFNCDDNVAGTLWVLFKIGVLP